jgi:hypothetical protein
MWGIKKAGFKRLLAASIFSVRQEYRQPAPWSRGKNRHAARTAPLPATIFDITGKSGIIPFTFMLFLVEDPFARSTLAPQVSAKGFFIGVRVCIWSLLHSSVLFDFLFSLKYPFC